LKDQYGIKLNYWLCWSCSDKIHQHKEVTEHVDYQAPKQVNQILISLIWCIANGHLSTENAVKHITTNFPQKTIALFEGHASRSKY
jgi:4-hydroxy-3-methylbut-2-en-1-yl diphosphate synthase IspG/GcpE